MQIEAATLSSIGAGDENDALAQQARRQVVNALAARLLLDDRRPVGSLGQDNRRGRACSTSVLGESDNLLSLIDRYWLPVREEAVEPAQGIDSPAIRGN